MLEKVDRLSKALTDAAHGGEACDAINALGQTARASDSARMTVLAVLMSYARSGRIPHMQVHALSTFADLASETDREYTRRLRRFLKDDRMAYWALKGLIRVSGVEAYKTLLKYVSNGHRPLECRAHAAKLLAQHSGQRFDNGLPSDPSYWKSEQLRLQEIEEWARKGFPSGPGYASPARDPALDHPESRLERAAARLDAKLAVLRQGRQDSANPSNWLSPAPTADLQAVTDEWSLPSIYVDFLSRFSPVDTCIYDERFGTGLVLYGASDLVKAQEGYAVWGSVPGALGGGTIDKWPAGMIVVGDDGGDPYTLDLSRSNGNEAPVCTAMHGMGDWDFEDVTDSFCAFLEWLAGDESK